MRTGEWFAGPISTFVSMGVFYIFEWVVGRISCWFLMLVERIRRKLGV